MSNILKKLKEGISKSDSKKSHNSGQSGEVTECEKLNRKIVKDLRRQHPEATPQDVLATAQKLTQAQAVELSMRAVKEFLEQKSPPEVSEDEESGDEDKPFSSPQSKLHLKPTSKKLQCLQSVKTVKQLSAMLLQPATGVDISPLLPKLMKILKTDEDVVYPTLLVALVHIEISLLHQKLINLANSRKIVKKGKWAVKSLFEDNVPVESLLASKTKPEITQARMIQNDIFQLFDQLYDYSELVVPKDRESVLSYEEALTLLRLQTSDNRFDLWPSFLQSGHKNFLSELYQSQSPFSKYHVDKWFQFINGHPKLVSSVVDRPEGFNKMLIE